jgi:hypothetical protein
MPTLRLAINAKQAEEWQMCISMRTEGSELLDEAEITLQPPVRQENIEEIRWYRVSRWRMDTPISGWLPLRFLGGLLIIAGLPVLVDSFARFALQGVGTPAPPYFRRSISSLPGCTGLSGIPCMWLSFR